MDRLDELDGDLMCAIIVGGKCGKWEEAGSWSVDIPDNKPEVVKPTLPQVTTSCSTCLNKSIFKCHLPMAVWLRRHCIYLRNRRPGFKSRQGIMILG
jgi:hypothetical protein